VISDRYTSNVVEYEKQLTILEDAYDVYKSSQECKDQEDMKKETRYGIISKLRNYRDNERKPFYVADMETLLNENNEHVPYAIGLLKCVPNVPVCTDDISTWFSADHIQLSSQDDRSTRILSSFVNNLESMVRRHRKCSVVYFHNFAHFEGIMLIRHLVRNHNYKLKPLMRNGELKVYYSNRHCIIFRDSLKLLPRSLESLANDLCPELGTKGSVDHSTVGLLNLKERKEGLLNYLVQYIRLLAGVMLKAQEIIFSEFGVDIVKKITISSLALTIFRKASYNDKTHPSNEYSLY